MPMRNLFYTDVDTLGDGKVLFEWSPKGNFLACCGSKVIVVSTSLSRFRSQ